MPILLRANHAANTQAHPWQAVALAPLGSAAQPMAIWSLRALLVPLAHIKTRKTTMLVMIVLQVRLISLPFFFF